MADTTNRTTVHTAEVKGQDDPVIIIERVAVSGSSPGYTDPTRRSYATDLRIFAGWCHDPGSPRRSTAVTSRPHPSTLTPRLEVTGHVDLPGNRSH
jgi:hypothetical protein